MKKRWGEQETANVSILGPAWTVEEEDDLLTNLHLDLDQLLPQVEPLHLTQKDMLKNNGMNSRKEVMEGQMQPRKSSLASTSNPFIARFVVAGTTRNS